MENLQHISATELEVITNAIASSEIKLKQNNIPKLLHLIWVGPNHAPESLDVYIKQWRELMPEWTIRLWGNDDINCNEFEESALQLINTANTGVQKADIMRYFIIKKYGGVYMDADVEPHKSLDAILYLPHDVILCHDLEFKWAYISIGFFAAIPNHPLLETCCRLLCVAELNVGSPHLHTGPRIMGRAIFETKLNDFVKYGLLPIQAFYRNKKGQEWINCELVKEDYDNRFGSHTYSKLWD